MGLCHGTCMQTEPGLFLNSKEVQGASNFARAMLAGRLDTHKAPWYLQEKRLSTCLLTCFMVTHTNILLTALHSPPLKPTLYSPMYEMKEDVEARTTGLPSRDHMNIPAVATKSPAVSDSGSACARGLEPWKNKGSLEEHVAWHWHCVFHQCCSRKTNKS